MESGEAYLHSNSSINTLWLHGVVTEAVQHSALTLSFHKGTEHLKMQQPVRDAPWGSQTKEDNKKYEQKFSKIFSDEKKWGYQKERLTLFYVIKYLQGAVCNSNSIHFLSNSEYISSLLAVHSVCALKKNPVFVLSPGSVNGKLKLFSHMNSRESESTYCFVQFWLHFLNGLLSTVHLYHYNSIITHHVSDIILQ